MQIAEVCQIISSELSQGLCRQNKVHPRLSANHQQMIGTFITEIKYFLNHSCHQISSIVPSLNMQIECTPLKFSIYP